MARSLRRLLPLAGAALLLTVAAAGQQAPGRILGIVTDAIGQPMAGATVRLLPVGVHKPPLLRQTALNGAFVFARLSAGAYYIEAGRGQRVSARHKVGVVSRQTSYLAIPLLYVLGSLRVNAPGTRSEQDFGWLLRANEAVRPVLRWEEASAGTDDAKLTGYVSLMAGGSPLPQTGAGAVSTSFRVERAVWGDADLAFSGTLGTTPVGTAGNNSRVRASFAPHGDRSPARLVVGMQQIPLPPLARAPNLQVVTFDYADGISVGNLSVQYGAMLTAVSLLNSLHSLDPYLRVQWQAGPHQHWEYRFASAVPPVHFGPNYAEMADPAPRLSLTGFDPHMERARHQEIGYDDNVTPNDQIELAVFADRFAHTAVVGANAQAGDLSAGNLLPDPFNDTFSTDGGSYGGVGGRIVYDRRLTDSLDAAVAWADGTVLAPRPGQLRAGNFAHLLAAARRQAITVKLAGVLPVTHTRIACSYRMLDRASATPVDPFDDTLAQSDSYANVTLRQPLPSFPFGSNRVEALAEFHNLLAQGYIPVMSTDGHLLYLIQAARSFRGGLSFNF